jgi:hypothetical protein
VQLINNSFHTVRGLLVTCAQTGVSLVAGCGSVNMFYFGSSFSFGQSMSVSTPGGTGIDCSNGNSNGYGFASNAGTVGQSGLVLHVT